MGKRNISLGNGVLEPVEQDFNKMIANTIEDMITRNAFSGKVTAKLEIRFNKKQNINEYGEVEEQIYPEFEHDISATIAIKGKCRGGVSNCGPLTCDEDGQFTVDVQDDQLHLV